MSERGELVEVFASARSDDVRERALVLRAQGIGFHRLQRGPLHLLLVDGENARVALRELAAYETENRDWPPVDETPPGRPGALAGTFVLVATLVVFHALAASDFLGLRWYERGAARAEAILGGQPWRALTSLFLHTGPVHLLSNAIFGALFGFCIAYSVGGRLALCAMLLAGGLGNLTNAMLVGAEHVSVGASTAVFGAVGLLGGTEWRRRHLFRERRLRRAAPIVMVLVLLAFHGVPTSPERVDVGAHVLGLAWGLVLGAFLPSLMARGWGERRGQRRAGILAASLVAAAWLLALLPHA